MLAAACVLLVLGSTLPTAAVELPRTVETGGAFGELPETGWKEQAILKALAKLRQIGVRVAKLIPELIATYYAESAIEERYENWCTDRSRTVEFGRVIDAWQNELGALNSRPLFSSEDGRKLSRAEIEIGRGIVNLDLTIAEANEQFVREVISRDSSFLQRLKSIGCADAFDEAFKQYQLLVQAMRNYRDALNTRQNALDEAESEAAGTNSASGENFSREGAVEFGKLLMRAAEMARARPQSVNSANEVQLTAPSDSFGDEVRRSLEAASGLSMSPQVGAAGPPSVVTVPRRESTYEPDTSFKEVEAAHNRAQDRLRATSEKLTSGSAGALREQHDATRNRMQQGLARSAPQPNYILIVPELSPKSDETDDAPKLPPYVEPGDTYIHQERTLVIPERR